MIHLVVIKEVIEKDNSSQREPQKADNFGDSD
jgi:hypothetical protein